MPCKPEVLKQVPLFAQLDDEETQLDTLRKKKQDLEGQQQLSDLSLRNMIQQLQMDVTL